MGVFQTGLYQYDDELAMVALDEAQGLLGLGRPPGQPQGLAVSVQGAAQQVDGCGLLLLAPEDLGQRRGHRQARGAPRRGQVAQCAQLAAGKNSLLIGVNEDGVADDGSPITTAEVCKENAQNALRSAVDIDPDNAQAEHMLAAMSADGDGAGWNPQIVSIQRHRPWDDEGRRLGFGDWIRLAGPTYLQLSIEPPQDVEQGELELHVRRRDTDEVAVVEYSLDARAPGPGCFTP